MLCGMLLDNKTTCKALVPSALVNMKNIINKCLLAGDKFMPEMHLKHDAAYKKYKDVENRLISDQKLTNSAYDIASNPKYDGYQRDLASMVYKFFDSKVDPLDKKLCQVKVMQSLVL